MNCDIEWVDIGEVEGLWYQFLLEVDAAEERHEPQSAKNYERLAGETLDVLTWALEDGGGYWWCNWCQCRHIID